MTHVSGVLNSKTVYFSFKGSSIALSSNYSKRLSSPKFSPNLKLAFEKSDGIGVRLPVVSGSRRAERNLKMNGLRCSAGFVLADEAYNENKAGDPSCVRMSQLKTLQRIRTAGLVACLRASSPELALDAARAALDGGLTVLEVTMTTPSAAQVIEALVQEYPSALIGAGTVLSMQEADEAKDGGAKFLMSPVTVEEIVCVHNDGPVMFIPGALTPTEVIHAYNLGALAVKVQFELYPVTLVGGVQFVAALSKPLHHIPLIPSHGIPLDMVESYMRAGATAVILSDAIFNKSALECRDFGRISFLAGEAASRSAIN